MEAVLAAAKHGRADSFQLGALTESEISKYVHTLHVHKLYIRMLYVHIRVRTRPTCSMPQLLVGED